MSQGMSQGFASGELTTGSEFDSGVPAPALNPIAPSLLTLAPRDSTENMPGSPSARTPQGRKDGPSFNQKPSTPKALEGSRRLNKSGRSGRRSSQHSGQHADPGNLETLEQEEEEYEEEYEEGEEEAVWGYEEFENPPDPVYPGPERNSFPEQQLRKLEKAGTKLSQRRDERTLICSFPQDYQGNPWPALRSTWIQWMILDPKLQLQRQQQSGGRSGK